MGQKVHPGGYRLGVVTSWKENWYAPKKDFANTLYDDIKARELIQKEWSQAGISKIEIERPAKNAQIKVFAARPGVIIGKGGKEVDTLRAKVNKILNVPVHISVEEVRKPELDAKLAAESVAQQLEKRVLFRRAMKRLVSTAMRQGAKGIKICVSGRLGGAEIARSEWYREGRVPLHTLRADIDYGVAEALTTYGIIGVKVWIFKGEVIGDAEQQQSEASSVEK